MAIKISGSGCGRRKRSDAFIFNFILGYSLIFLVVGSCSGFFIDLEALGFPMSKSDIGDDDGLTSGSILGSGSELIIATPTSLPEKQEMVEIESKTDPNKSVKLTLAELKQLVLGTVKDLTPNPPPINIKITSQKDSSTDPSTSTTPKPKPKKVKKINPYKYLDSMLDAFTKLKDVDSYSVDGVSSNRWKRPQSTSFMLPPYGEEGIEEHYANTNEVVDFDGAIVNNNGKVNSAEDGKKGWFTAAKAVFRAPSHVMNSYTKSFGRWRSGGKAKNQPPRVHPIADITYSPEQRRKNKRPSPPPPRSSRRPVRRRGGRPGQRRGGQHQKPKQRLKNYYGADEYDNSKYASYNNDNNGRYSSIGYYGGGGEGTWDRTDHLTSEGAIFDSTMPNDDTPYNMRPPVISY